MLPAPDAPFESAAPTGPTRLRLVERSLRALAPSFEPRRELRARYPPQNLHRAGALSHFANASDFAAIRQPRGCVLAEVRAANRAIMRGDAQSAQGGDQ